MADKASLLLAEETLQFVWKSASVGTKAVILVGNKTDLVRSRVVTTEGELTLTFVMTKYTVGASILIVLLQVSRI